MEEGNEKRKILVNLDSVSYFKLNKNKVLIYFDNGCYFHLHSDVKYEELLKIIEITNNLTQQNREQIKKQIDRLEQVIKEMQD